MPFYLQRSFPVFPLPKPTGKLLTELADRNGGSLYVLALLRPDIADAQLQLTLLKRYSQTNSALYLFSSASPGKRSTAEQQARTVSSIKETVPTIEWLKGHYSDGWTAEKFEFTIHNQQAATVAVAISNPTPLKRKYQIRSSIDTIQGEIGSDSKLTFSLKIAVQDVIHGDVSPVFIPRQHGAGPDDRTLGINLQLQPL